MGAKSKHWWLSQELTALAKIQATEFACRLINFTTNFELTDNLFYCYKIMEPNSDASLAELWIASTDFGITFINNVLPTSLVSPLRIASTRLVASLFFIWTTKNPGGECCDKLVMMVANTSPKTGLQCMWKENRVDVAREPIFWRLFPQVALPNRIPLLPHPNSLVYNLIKLLFEVIRNQIVPIDQNSQMSIKKLHIFCGVKKMAKKTGP